MKPSDIKKTKTQVVIANTYHLWDKSSTTFLREELGTKLPIMTDSGGFQVFSLGFGRENKVGKVLNKQVGKKIKRENIKITNKGVYFIDGPDAKGIEDPRFDNRASRESNRDKKRFLGPELSIQIQKKLGADIIFAFDECTSPLDGFDYNKKALGRTHAWAKICLEQMAKRGSKKAKQMLFGIVQGGRFKSLRIKSAKYIASLPFDGIGIGGSFGKDEMTETLKWIAPHLPEEKPRHLLGIGKIKDIFNAIEQGMDTFDCVIPTREARHGRIYTKNGYFDIRKYQSDKVILEKGCACSVCKKKFTRSKLNNMFKINKPLAQRYATIHNIWFFNNLLENIRKSIHKDEFSKFKNKFLANFYAGYL